MVGTLNQPQGWAKYKMQATKKACTIVYKNLITLRNDLVSFEPQLFTAGRQYDYDTLNIQQRIYCQKMFAHRFEQLEESVMRNRPTPAFCQEFKTRTYFSRALLTWYPQPLLAKYNVTGVEMMTALAQGAEPCGLGVLTYDPKKPFDITDLYPAQCTQNGFYVDYWNGIRFKCHLLRDYTKPCVYDAGDKQEYYVNYNRYDETNSPGFIERVVSLVQQKQGNNKA